MSSSGNNRKKQTRKIIDNSNQMMSTLLGSISNTMISSGLTHISSEQAAKFEKQATKEYTQKYLPLMQAMSSITEISKKIDTRLHTTEQDVRELTENHARLCKITRKNPNSLDEQANLFLDIAGTYITTYQYKQAIDYYKKVLAIRDDNQANTYLAGAYIKHGVEHHPEAKVFFETHEKNGSIPFLAIHMGLAKVYYQRGEFALSLQHAQQIISDNDDDFYLLELLGLLHVEFGDLEQAEKFFKSSVDRYEKADFEKYGGRYISPHVNLIKVDLVQKLTKDNAEEYITKLKALSERDPKQSEIYFLLAFLHSYTGKYAEAKQLLLDTIDSIEAQIYSITPTSTATQQQSSAVNTNPNDIQDASCLMSIRNKRHQLFFAYSWVSYYYIKESNHQALVELLKDSHAHFQAETYEALKLKQIEGLSCIAMGGVKKGEKILQGVIRIIDKLGKNNQLTPELQAIKEELKAFFPQQTVQPKLAQEDNAPQPEQKSDGYAFIFNIPESERLAIKEKIMQYSQNCMTLLSAETVYPQSNRTSPPISIRDPRVKPIIGLNGQVKGYGWINKSAKGVRQLQPSFFKEFAQHATTEARERGQNGVKFHTDEKGAHLAKIKINGDLRLWAEEHKLSDGEVYEFNELKRHTRGGGLG